MCEVQMSIRNVEDEEIVRIATMLLLYDDRQVKPRLARSEATKVKVL